MSNLSCTQLLFSFFFLSLFENDVHASEASAEGENEGGALDNPPRFLLLYACSTISMKRENRRLWTGYTEKRIDEIAATDHTVRLLHLLKFKTHGGQTVWI